MRNPLHAAFLLALLLPAASLSGCKSDEGVDPQQKLAMHREFGRKYFENNQLTLAENQVDLGLEIASKDVTLRLMKAWIRQKRGSPEDVLVAERLFRELVREDDYRAMLGLGQALERKGVMYWESAGPVERGERATKAVDPERRGAEMREQAQGFWRESAAWYEKTLAKKSGEIQAVNGLQRVWALLGDVEKSLKWSDALLAQATREIDFWRGELQRPDLRAIEEQEYRKLLSSSSVLLVETRMAASTSLVELGRKQEAIAQLDLALEIAPERAEIYSRRAQLRHELGALSGARDDLQMFLRLSTLPVDHPDMRRAFDLLAECEVALRGTGKLRD